MMNYLLSLILVLVIFGVLALGVSYVPYQGVVSIMGVSFFCCILMVVLGRTFAALVVYIIYLGGLVVVFGYCVSVEKDEADISEIGVGKYFIIFVLMAVVFLFLVTSGWMGGFLVYHGWEDMVCMEVNGSCVFYSIGGSGLIVCIWGLLGVLFSMLVILGRFRLGSLRSF